MTNPTARRPSIGSLLIETLAAHLKRNGELPVGEAARILLALTGALLRAQRNGIVYLDLSPEKIRLESGDAGRCDVVIDWSLATIGGMPSHELALSSDGRGDVHALGVVAYQMLAGAPPLPSSLMSARPDVPAALDALLRSMMAKNPTKRPGLGEVRRQLAALTHDDDLESTFAQSAARAVVADIAGPLNQTRRGK